MAPHEPPPSDGTAVETELFAVEDPLADHIEQLTLRAENHREAAADLLRAADRAEARARLLTVAQEPWPFWAGEDEAQRVAAWRQSVGWRPEWGTATPVGRLNGSSGRAVQDRVLHPLGLDPAQVWTTDALPFFHVHRTPGSQGQAMTTRYDPFARTHGLPPHQLPDRPATDQLIRRAVEEEGARLLDELLDSSAPLLITLGNEALAVAAHLLDGDLPDRLTPDGSYGQQHAARARGTAVEVLPLVHPGQRGAAWTEAHEQWVRSRSER